MSACLHVTPDGAFNHKSLVDFAAHERMRPKVYRPCSLAEADVRQYVAPVIWDVLCSPSWTLLVYRYGNLSAFSTSDRV